MAGSKVMAYEGGITGPGGLKVTSEEQVIRSSVRGIREPVKIEGGKFGISDTEEGLQVPAFYELEGGKLAYTPAGRRTFSGWNISGSGNS